MARQKCKHDNRFFCNVCSKIKMVICLKNEAKPFYNNRNTVTRYSLLTQDKKPDHIIIKKMTQRLLVSKAGEQGECFEGHYNKVIIYDNESNTIIQQ